VTLKESNSSDYVAMVCRLRQKVRERWDSTGDHGLAGLLTSVDIALEQAVNFISEVTQERDNAKNVANKCGDALARCLREIVPDHIPGDVYTAAQRALALNADTGECEHDWERVQDWGGDPSIPNGTFNIEYVRCVHCGAEGNPE
jgi:hypothetical protein